MGIIGRQSIKNNFITYLGVLIGFLNLLVIQPLILSPDELGLLRLLYSVSALFASIYPLGLNVFTLKYFSYIRNSKNGHNGYLGFAILASTLLFIIGSVAFYFFKPVLLSKYANSQLFINEFNYIFPLSYFLGLFSLLTAYSSSLFKTTFPSFLNEILIRVLMVLALGLYFLKLISFEVLIDLYVFSYLLIIISLIIYFKKTDVIKFKINWAIFKIIPIWAAVKFTLIMSITSLASISIRNIDAAFIGSYMSLADVAVYTIAFTISSMIDVPGNALAKIIIPKISEAFKDDKFDFIKNIYYKSTGICLLAGSFLFILIFINAYDILSLLPKKYVEGVFVLKIIAIGAFINSAFGLNVSLIQYSKKYVFASISLILLAILSAASNILLIPYFGLIGAAISTAVSLIALNIVCFFFIKKQFNLQPFKWADGLIILITVIIIGLDSLVPKMDNGLLSIIIKSGIVSIVFVILVFKMNLAEELRNILSIKSLIQKRASK